ncbi:AraC family transcriptional regulator [Asanoa ishikariensis]|uniref:AraC-type DNA-binding protein n=1 Tax=Asanoa ishikariensis TaxID=137265 RepID=A0A1H3RX76_9ACTN|nr:AraC family transcriptional regulator [Asanoa ishikariensis]GIF66792.1 AraC family transcriptional regulator [Asanoa ishikariensis]SDZ29469.1 AraC-type DNA-binding protein [Asanoa ishikariensis]
MQTGRTLATGPGFTVGVVTCTDDHAGWSPVESTRAHAVVLPRRGLFRRMVDGVGVDLDPTVGYLSVPAAEERFAHPHGGDVCTALSVSAALWRSVAGDRRSRSAIYVDGRLDLAHRRLLRAASGFDRDYRLVESLVALLGLVASRSSAAPVPAAGLGSAADRLLVARARAAIAADDPAARGLLPLAGFLSASPYRLSRVFSREMGVSLTHYRNRVRVGRALDRLSGGDTDGARLASDLGFADQAHLCRTIRTHVGHTPTEVRMLLTH